MTKFKLKPAPVSGTLRTLRAQVAQGIKPTGAKTVGGGIIKIFMPDDTPHVYMSDGVEARKVLRSAGVDI